MTDSMSKKITDQDGVVAQQLADAIVYAIRSGKYMPLAVSDHLNNGAAFSPLDVMTQGVLSQLLTIAALDGSLGRINSTKDLLSQLYSLRRAYPELAEMIDFVIAR